MTQVITATYADGMLRPDVQPNLAPGTRVQLILLSLECAAEDWDSASAELDQLCAQFPVDSGGARLSRDQLHERR